VRAVLRIPEGCCLIAIIAMLRNCSELTATNARKRRSQRLATQGHEDREIANVQRFDGPCE
jgi:hypothetical protein